MDKKPLKTLTEIKLEGYLNQQNKKYEYEPFNTKDQGIKIPDYLIIDGYSVIAEVKEVESIPLDRVRGIGSLDTMGVAKIVQRRINEACKQLKPHANKADYAIILIGKKSGFEIGTNDLEWAIYGDPVFRIPVDIKTGDPIGEPYYDMKVKGALRSNNAVTKAMEFHATYVSGIGLIKAVNGYNYHLHLLYEKYQHAIDKDTPAKARIEQKLKEYEEIQVRYSSEIPAIYREDREKMIFYIQFTANIFAKKLLPQSFFTGKLDSYKTHKIVYR